MEYKNIFQINKNTKCVGDNNILHLSNSNFNIKANIKINFLKSVYVDMVIGFSMNLDYIEIKLNKNIVIVDKIMGIKLFVKSGDKIEIQPSKSNTYYEVYLNIVDIKSLSIFSKSKINMITHDKIHDITHDKTHNDFTTSNETQLDFYFNINSNKFKKNNVFDGIKKIIIITTKFIQSIGDYFKIIFEKRGIRCKIKYSLDIPDCLKTYDMTDTLFIIMFNNSTHFLLPNKFIFYQIEQLGSVFLTDKNFISRLKYSCLKSQQVWEYTNLTSHIYSKYCENKLKYVSMPFVLDKELGFNDLEWNNLKYDIFFYGNKNERREKILKELNKYFKIKIGWGVYGEKKIEYIMKSKIILNLHYYEEAGLETCRFNEILNYNKLIISENSLLDISNTKLYDNIVVMVDNIDDKLSNMDKLIEYIRHFLIYENYLKKINENKTLIEKLEKKIIDKIIE